MAGDGDIRAGRAFVELFVKNNMFFKALDDAGKRLKKFGGGVTALGTGMLAIGSAIVGPLVAATKSFASAGSAVYDMSVRTGLSAEAIGVLGHAAKMTGADIEDVERSVRKMQVAISDAAIGSKTATKALAQIGLSASDLIGLAPEQQLGQIANGLFRITNSGAKAAAAVDLFGESGTVMLPMLSEGAVGLETFRAEAERLGLVLSTEDTKAADSLGDSLDRLTGSVRSVWLRIGAALAPAVEELSDTITGLVTGIRRWVADNGELVRTLAKVGVTVAAVGSVLIIFGGSITALGFALSGITAIAGIAASGLAFLASPVAMVLVGLVGAVAAAFRFRDSLGTLKPIIDRIASAFRRFIEPLRRDFANAWSGIVDAVLAGDLSLAGEIAMKSLQITIAKGLAAIQTVIGSIWGEAIGDMAARVAAGDIQGAWETMLAAMNVAWSEFATGVMEDLESLSEWFKLIGKTLGATFLPESKSEQVGRLEKEAAYRRRSYESAKRAREEAGKTAPSEREKETKQKLDDVEKELKIRKRYLLANQRMSQTANEQAWTRQLTREELNERFKRRMAEVNARVAAGGKPAPESEAMRALRERIASRSTTVDVAIREAQAELDRLRGEASKKRDEGRERPGEAEAGGDIASALAGRTAVTFSGAGLLALGAGGGPQERMANDIRRQVIIQERQLEATKRMQQKLEALAFKFR